MTHLPRQRRRRVAPATSPFKALRAKGGGGPELAPRENIARPRRSARPTRNPCSIAPFRLDQKTHRRLPDRDRGMRHDDIKHQPIDHRAVKHARKPGLPQQKGPAPGGQHKQARHDGGKAEMHRQTQPTISQPPSNAACPTRALARYCSVRQRVFFLPADGGNNVGCPRRRSARQHGQGQFPQILFHSRFPASNAAPFTGQRRALVPSRCGEIPIFF